MAIDGPFFDGSSVVVSDAGTDASLRYWVDGDFYQAPLSPLLPEIGQLLPGSDPAKNITLRAKRAVGIRGEPPQCEVQCEYSSRSGGFGAAQPVGVTVRVSDDGKIVQQDITRGIWSRSVTKYSGKLVLQANPVMLATMKTPVGPTQPGSPQEGISIEVSQPFLTARIICPQNIFYQRLPAWDGAMNKVNSDNFLGAAPLTVWFRGPESRIDIENGIVECSFTWLYKPDKWVYSWEIIKHTAANTVTISTSNDHFVHEDVIAMTPIFA